MNARRMRMAIVFIGLVISLGGLPRVIAGEFVLVGAVSPDRDPFTLYEIRKIFLGHSVERDGARIKGVINVADQDNYSVFLQKLIHLSAKDYERRLVSRTFRTGVSSVSKAETFAELKLTLLADASAISVVRSDQLEGSDGLEVIQVLWKVED